MGKTVKLLNMTKEEAGCIATVVASVLDLGLLKKAPVDIEINIRNGLIKLIHYAGEKYPV